jgi:ankyrin repeat protein
MKDFSIYLHANLGNNVKLDEIKHLSSIREKELENPAGESEFKYDNPGLHSRKTLSMPSRNGPLSKVKLARKSLVSFY